MCEMDNKNSAFTFKEGKGDAYEENDSCLKCKEEIDRCKFQLELSLQKERNHQLALQKMTDIQKEYESHLIQLSKDYKAKEDSLKQKYKVKEELLLKDQKDSDLEHERDFERVKKENNRLQVQLEETEREMDKLKEQLAHTATNTRLIQQDYRNEIVLKERQLAELEANIKSLTDEANKQIDHLAQQNKDLVNELQNYRQNDQIALDNVTASHLPKHHQSKQPSNVSLSIKSKGKQIEELSNEPSISIPNHSINAISQYDVSKIKELRERIKELEKETVALTRELSLKYEECDSLHEEIAKLKQPPSDFVYQYSNEGYNQCQAYPGSDRDEDVNDYQRRIEELEALIHSYGQNILLIKDTYEKVVIEHNNEVNNLVHNYESRIEQILNESNKLKQAMNKEERIKDSVSNWQSTISKYYVKGIPKVCATEVPTKKRIDNFDMRIEHNEGRMENLTEQVTSLKGSIENMN